MKKTILILIMLCTAAFGYFDCTCSYYFIDQNGKRQPLKLKGNVYYDQTKNKPYSGDAITECGDCIGSRGNMKDGKAYGNWKEVDEEELAKEIITKAAAAVKKGSFIDTRDNKTYKIVNIGKQTWMAENLNCDVSGSKCYGNKSENCTKYGRLYDWATALTVCTSGWHLPSDAEWTTLEKYVGNLEGTKLKATSGWVNRYGEPEGNGTDDYGFAALPGGLGGSDGFYHAGSIGYYWSSTEYNANTNYAYYRIISYNDNYVGRFSDEKSDFYSIRCVRD